MGEIQPIAVGGSFIFSLHVTPASGLPNPTNAVGGSFIFSLYATPASDLPNPTNAVGGSFIFNLVEK